MAFIDFEKDSGYDGIGILLLKLGETRIPASGIVVREQHSSLPRNHRQQIIGTATAADVLSSSLR